MINTILNLYKSYSDQEENVLKTGATSEKPLGRLPNWLSKSEKVVPSASSVKKVNKYIAYQETRLLNLRSRGEFKKVVIL